MKIKQKDTGIFEPRTISLILVGLVAGLITAFAIMNSRAAKNIEYQASQIFQLPVTVDDVNLSYVSHTVKISGLKIQNPEGFTAPHAAVVEDLRIYTQGLNANPVNVTKIEVNGLVLYPERDEFGETNLAYLLDGIFDQTPQNSDITLSVALNKIFIKDMRLRPQGNDYADLEKRIAVDPISPLSDNAEIITVTPEELVKLITQSVAPRAFQNLLTAQIASGINSALQISQDFIRELEEFADSLSQVFQNE